MQRPDNTLPQKRVSEKNDRNEDYVYTIPPYQIGFRANMKSYRRYSVNTYLICDSPH